MKVLEEIINKINSLKKLEISKEVRITIRILICFSIALILAGLVMYTIKDYLGISNYIQILHGFILGLLLVITYKTYALQVKLLNKEIKELFKLKI